MSAVASSASNKYPQHVFIEKKAKLSVNTCTVMIQCFRTHGSGQSVQTQIRLLLGDQSDQGLHCLLFHLHLFDEITKGLASFHEF